MSRFYERLANNRQDGPELRQCVRSCVDQLKTVGTEFNRPGMLLGRIQSGKTRAFLGVIALAFDEGFNVAIVLTKGTQTLARQTVQRISDDFREFRTEDAIQVYDIMSVPNLSAWEVQSHKLIFVVKKEHRNLERLHKLLTETQPILQSRRTLIIDDEADFASVRFHKPKGQEEVVQGRIADQMDDLRRTLANSAFLQVTATPYSLYLQPEEYEVVEGQNFSFEPKRPAFTVLLPIHGSYVGGEHYFGSHEPDMLEDYLWTPVEEDELTALKKEDRRRVREGEALTSPRIAALRQAVVCFVIGAIIRRLQQTNAGENTKKYALIVHVETARASHSWQEKIVGEIIDEFTIAIRANLAVAERLIDQALEDLSPSLQAAGLDIPHRDLIRRDFEAAFSGGGVICEKVNSDNDVMALLDENAELKLRTPYNIFIGGQILDRGITIPNLIGFYYGRSPKRMQQDTVLQHSRMYGARPRADLAVTRFYTTYSNHEALTNIHEFDSALRHAFETGAHDRGVAFIQRDGSRVVPCSPSKIMVSNIKALRAGGRWLPVGFHVLAKSRIERTIAKLDNFIDVFDCEDEPKQVSLDVALDVLRQISDTLTFDKSGNDFDWKSFYAALDYFSKIAAPERIAGNVWVLAAKDRTISRLREGGRYSDAPDTKQQRDALSEVAEKLPALVLLRQNGLVEDGWSGHPFWWPVFIAPSAARTSVFASSGTE